jgi:hypothetical protein
VAAMGPGGRIDVVVVVGGRWHDLDYARLRLLAELDRHDRVRTRVFEDYRCAAALADADALISYACDLRPDETAQSALVDFVGAGGRWLALHGTNSAIDPPPPGGPRVFRTPRALGPVAPVLGSQFLGHPPIGPYEVEAVSDDPLVAGVPPFVTTDELYVSALHPPLRVLLRTRFSGACPGFAEGGTDSAEGADGSVQPVLYRKRTGAGEVCYFTLGHCRGRYDVQDLGVADLGKRDRGSWETPEFALVLSRTVAWAVHGDDWPVLSPSLS